MHLGNGAITPECALLSASVAAAGLGFAAASLRRSPLAKDQWLLAGALGSAVFAAQMVNFPVLPYASGHLVGGVLLATMLRPGLGALTMALILAVQALVLGDGSLSALGANVINMALVPALVVAAAQGSRRVMLAGAQAMVATVLAAALVVLEVSIARTEWTELPLSTFAWEMISAHLAIGLVEGGLTAAVLWSVAKAGSLQRQATALAIATLVLVALAPLASSLPDGYEAAAERSDWQSLLGESPGVVAPETLPL